MKNIFIVGTDDFNLGMFRVLGRAQEYSFHPLFNFADIRRPEGIPVKAVMDEIESRLCAFSGSVDAIVGYGDFPISTMLPVLREKFGLVTPTLESVLKCEHKCWSRLEQAAVIPQSVPRFADVDPCASDPLAGIDFSYPFWLKPVKAVLSHLGFRIEDENDFHQSIAIVRRRIGRYAEPFDYLLGFASLPDPLKHVDGWHCIAEQMVSTPRQCTVEGYVFQGEIEVYGIVGSSREGPHGSCFNRYQY